MVERLHHFSVAFRFVRFKDTSNFVAGFTICGHWEGTDRHTGGRFYRCQLGGDRDRGRGRRAVGPCGGPAPVTVISSRDKLSRSGQPRSGDVRRSSLPPTRHPARIESSSDSNEPAASGHRGEVPLPPGRCDRAGSEHTRHRGIRNPYNNTTPKQRTNVYVMALGCSLKKYIIKQWCSNLTLVHRVALVRGGGGGARRLDSAVTVRQPCARRPRTSHCCAVGRPRSFVPTVPVRSAHHCADRARAESCPSRRQIQL